MAETIEFSTERLRLRQWAPQDREPFAAMNADPEVMKYFAGVGTREGSFRAIDVWQSELEERGWSNWAVEHVESRAFNVTRSCPVPLPPAVLDLPSISAPSGC
jgi:RimJ/RimL family protein N-acetyltransferase